MCPSKLDLLSQIPENGRWPTIIFWVLLLWGLSIAQGGPLEPRPLQSMPTYCIRSCIPTCVRTLSAAVVCIAVQSYVVSILRYVCAYLSRSAQRWLDWNFGLCNSVLSLLASTLYLVIIWHIRMAISDWCLLHCQQVKSMLSLCNTLVYSECLSLLRITEFTLPLKFTLLLCVYAYPHAYRNREKGHFILVCVRFW